MAAGNTPQGANTAGSGEEDLSMEEILQSIRKIIAEDDSEPKKAAPIEPEDTDVLELTEMVTEDGSVVSLKSEEKPVEPVKDEAPADVLNSIDQALAPEKPPEKPVEPAKVSSPQDDIDAMFAAIPATPEVIPEAVAPPTPAAPVAKSLPVETTDSLLSDEASHAAVSSIQKLKAAEPELPPLHVSPSPLFRSGNTVEDMVADMLRPMMKSWLDANLPQIVERIVEREVKKLTKYLTDPGE